MDDETREIPAIVLVGVGGGGSRILSEGLEKIEKNSHIDRYQCLARAISARSEEPHAFIIDTSSDPETPGFYTNIPKRYKISLSSSIKGMSRGAGGRPGRAAKAVLNEDVSRTLAQRLYKPIADIHPSIVVFIHTADGGTGGGLAPELLYQLAYVLPSSTVFWVFTVMPTRTKLALSGPRTVGPNLGKMIKVIRRVTSRNWDSIPFQCRNAIREVVEARREDQSYEFQHSRIALFPMSNNHFAKAMAGSSRRDFREEVLNPFPIELLSQSLYPFLKYVVADLREQQWMQKNWPMGPIDIPDIMAGVSPDRPIVLPHLLPDPDMESEEFLAKTIQDLKDGRITLDKVEGVPAAGDGELAVPESFTFTGTPTSLHEFRATSMYCIPVYPDGSRYFEDFGELVSDLWFPMLSGEFNYIGGPSGRKVGVISHSANLKPQPISRPKDGVLGFDDGLLTTLIFGAVPKDFPVWLMATREILHQHKTEDLWELSYYDAHDYLNTLGNYIGWERWLTMEADPTAGERR